MSEYHKMQTSFVQSEEESLVKALVDVGFDREHIEVHEQAENLRGYRNDRRVQKANVIIRKEHVGVGSNDIGFERMPDGSYEMRVSEYDQQINPKASKIGMSYDGRFLKKLSGHYGMHVQEKVMLRKGYRLQQTIPVSATKKRMIWVK